MLISDRDDDEGDDDAGDWDAPLLSVREDGGGENRLLVLLLSVRVGFNMLLVSLRGGGGGGGGVYAGACGAGDP